MELKEYGDILVSYQRNGNDKNGNPVYLINVFKKFDNEHCNNCWVNLNCYYSSKLDKNYNIRMKSYNIEEDIKNLIL